LTAAGLPLTACEPPYPTEETAHRVQGTLSRGTTQAVLAKMDSVSKNHGHVSFKNADGEALGKRISWEGERRTSSIIVPVALAGAGAGAPGGGVRVNRDVDGGGIALGKQVPSIFGGGDAAADLESKPSFDRTQSWKREDKKRDLYQQERLMDMERRNGKEFGYESVSERY
jgi:hypothetical protein